MRVFCWCLELLCNPFRSWRWKKSAHKENIKEIKVCPHFFLHFVDNHVFFRSFCWFGCVIKIRPQHFKNLRKNPSLSITFFLYSFNKKNLRLKVFFSEPRPNSTAYCLDFIHSMRTIWGYKKKFNKVELIKVQKNRKKYRLSLLKRSKICIKNKIITFDWMVDSFFSKTSSTLVSFCRFPFANRERKTEWEWCRRHQHQKGWKILE